MKKIKKDNSSCAKKEEYEEKKINWKKKKNI